MKPNAPTRKRMVNHFGTLLLANVGKNRKDRMVIVRPIRCWPASILMEKRESFSGGSFLILYTKRRCTRKDRMKAIGRTFHHGKKIIAMVAIAKIPNQLIDRFALANSRLR
jgi:hypothetical protein